MLAGIDILKVTVSGKCSAGNLEPRFGNHGLQTLDFRQQRQVRESLRKKNHRAMVVRTGFISLVVPDLTDRAPIADQEPLI